MIIRRFRVGTILFSIGLVILVFFNTTSLASQRKHQCSSEKTNCMPLETTIKKTRSTRSIEIKIEERKASEKTARSKKAPKAQPLCSPIFKYKPTPGRTPEYLHTKLKGQTSKGYAWSARDVGLDDIPFHQTLYGNPKIMANFGDGLPRIPESIQASFTNTWIPRYAKGHGGITIFDVNGNRVGHLLTGVTDQPGVSQISYLYSEDVWGHGMGTSVLSSIVNYWAPEVRRIGLGVGLQECDASKVTAFRCFKGKPLKALEATARQPMFLLGKY